MPVMTDCDVELLPREETERSPKLETKGRGHVGLGVLLAPREFWKPRFVNCCVELLLCSYVPLWDTEIIRPSNVCNTGQTVYTESSRTARAI